MLLVSLRLLPSVQIIPRVCSYYDHSIFYRAFNDFFFFSQLKLLIYVCSFFYHHIESKT